MQKYLSQLLADLEAAAANPPAPVWIEIPPHMETLPEAAELALVPFKPISEWTGIDQNVFPAMYNFSADQCEELNRAIFKVLESIRVEIVDLPENIPPERLYDVITWCWDDPVQYLPSTGYDLELCTGNPDTCPYGDLCDCGIRKENHDESEDDPPVHDDSDEPFVLPF
jgi:hypothetical protein